MAIAMFYMAEGTGLVPRGQYFPTLPRLEASASDPAAWFGAIQWGAAALAHSGGANIPMARNTQLPSLSVPAIQQRIAGYYGS
jgi:hypothetical protein